MSMHCYVQVCMCLAATWQLPWLVINVLHEVWVRTKWGKPKPNTGQVPVRSQFHHCAGDKCWRTCHH